MKYFLPVIFLLFPTIAFAQNNPRNPCYYQSVNPSPSDGCLPVTPSTPLPVNASVTATANTVAKATAVAPTYTEGSTDSLSMDLNGGLRITGTINATSAATATANAPTYTEGQAAAFSQNLSGDLRTIAKQGGTWTVSQGGTWNINNISGTVSLPTGAATAALQSTINSTLGSPFQAGGSIGNTAFGISGTLPGFASTPTFNLGTLNGAATAANQTTGNSSLSSIDSKTPALGQALAAGSVPVILPAATITTLTPPTSITANAGTNLNTSALALESGGNLASLVAQIGAVTASPPANTVMNRLQTINTTLGSPMQNSGGSVGISGTLPAFASPPAVTINSGTVTVSGAVTANLGTLNGAATAAKQPALGTAGSPSADVISVQGVVGGTAVPVSAASLPLPTGASTSANQTNGTQKTQIVDGSGNVISSTSNALNVALAPSTTAIGNVGTVPRAAQLSTAPVTISSSGDNTVVTRAVGTIKVYRMALTCASAVTMTIKNGAGTALSGAMPNVTSVYTPYEGGEPQYTTTGTNNFIINLGSAVSCGGTVWYVDN